DLQMGVEAVFVVVFTRRQRATTAQIELVPHQGQSSPQCAGAGEWPEVTRAVVRLQARQGEARNQIVQVDLEQQKPFVVPKTDVVARVKFLDQLAFEQHRLGFAAHEMNINIANGLDQRVELQVPAHPPRRVKILAHPPAQIARLADIYHGPEPVLHQVNARLMRQLAQLLPNLIRNSHDPILTAPG